MAHSSYSPVGFIYYPNFALLLPSLPLVFQKCFFFFLSIDVHFSMLNCFIVHYLIE